MSPLWEDSQIISNTLQHFIICFVFISGLFYLYCPCLFLLLNIYFYALLCVNKLLFNLYCKTFFSIIIQKLSFRVLSIERKTVTGLYFEISG